MIPEPQKTYVLELLQALGPAADEFVVAGAQAMKLMVDRTRATKDVDFVLDVVFPFLQCLYKLVRDGNLAAFVLLARSRTRVYIGQLRLHG